MNKILSVLLLLLTLASGASAQNWQYFYFKEPRPLTLDNSRLAVLRAPNAGADTAQKLATKHGLGKPAVGVFPVARWTMLRNLPARPAGEMPRLSAQMAQEAEAEFVSPVFRSREGEDVVITPDILVRFAPQVGKLQAQQILAEVGTIQQADWGGMPGAYRVRSHSRDGFTVLEAANRLAQRQDTLWAEPDLISTGTLAWIPNDPNFGNCWGLRNTGQFSGTVDMDMDADEAWDNTIGDANVIIVVMDSGVQQNHPDINQRAGADFTTDGGNGGPVNANDNHGTTVAGCVSAIINNSLGTVGVAPGCRVASARIGIQTGGTGITIETSWMVNALTWAQSIGARVTNSSLSMTSVSALTDKYTQTRNAGIIHFAATGNSGANSIAYPASIGIVNAVGSIDRNGNRSSFSQFGTGIDFVAPGEAIATTDRTGADGYNPSGDYTNQSGTSLASPYAAGVAALAFSVNPNLSADVVEQALRDSCMDLGNAGYDTTFGHGLLNANTVVRSLGIYVDKNYTGTERGTPSQPYRTIAAAINAANLNNRTALYIRGGGYDERPLTNKRLYFRKWEPTGNPRIGAP